MNRKSEERTPRAGGYPSPGRRKGIPHPAPQVRLAPASQDARQEAPARRGWLFGNPETG
jgi:hypothetical protein